MMGLPLSNQQVVVRLVTAADSDQLSDLLSDHETVVQSGLRLPDPVNKSAWNWAMTTLTNSKELLVIEERRQGKIAGLISLVKRGNAYELGYLLGPSFRGRGLMTIAIKLILGNFQRQGALTTVIAATDSHNHASINVLRRTGFKKQTDGNDDRRIEWTWSSYCQKK